MGKCCFSAARGQAGKTTLAKAYLYDWVEVPEKAFRSKNLAALHLYKAASLWRALGQADSSRCRFCGTWRSLELNILSPESQKISIVSPDHTGLPLVVIAGNQARRPELKHAQRYFYDRAWPRSRARSCARAQTRNYWPSPKDGLLFQLPAIEHRSI